MGDSARIRQVLTNLLGNAVKFTDKGEISIKVKLIKRADSDEGAQLTLMIEVTDTGIGITPEVRERLFQPFSQGDISTSRKYGGTGLGLAISKRLIEMMGGKIDVDSFPGRGTKFWITLTLLESKTAATKVEYTFLLNFKISAYCVSMIIISIAILSNVMHKTGIYAAMWRECSGRIVHDAPRRSG